MHAGDFVAVEVLEELRGLARELVGVHGNVDDAALQAELPARVVAEAGSVRIGVVHAAGPAAGRHERLRSWFPDCGIVVYGHTHVPEVTFQNGVWIVNPGSPTERRRAPTRSMALIKRTKPRLVSLP